MRAALGWIDSWAGTSPADDLATPRPDWLRIVPFLLLHAAVGCVALVGTSPVAVGVAAALYLVRMFGITAGYHRYFSHRAYKTSRAFQFLLGWLGATAVQRGPLWWSAHHRHHHRSSDTPADPHSPAQHGFLWSHVGWFTARANLRTRVENVPDWMRVPELVWLDRYTFVPVLALAGATYALGAWLAAAQPALGTSGPQMLVWGFVVSTVLLYHGTFSINSLAHRIGKARYATGDDSKNHLGLALVTLGEGWHNNHHHYPSSARQGFRWWEVDISYGVLRVLSWAGLVWDLKGVPDAVRDAPAPTAAPAPAPAAGPAAAATAARDA
ncbi:MAG: acyl-CoA desaturase [Planctomycetia bacterium]